MRSHFMPHLNFENHISLGSSPVVKTAWLEWDKTDTFRKLLLRSFILTNFSGEPRFFSEGVCLSFPSAAWRGQETSCGSVLVLQKFSLSFFSLLLFTRLCSALMQISKHNITVNWERVSARNGHNQTSWCFFGSRQRLVIKPE